MILQGLKAAVIMQEVKKSYTLKQAWVLEPKEDKVMRINRIQRAGNTGNYSK